MIEPHGLYYPPRWIRESNLIEDVDDPEEDLRSYGAWEWLTGDDPPSPSVSTILELHRRIMKHLNLRIAGKLRRVAVYVGGRTCPPPESVPMLLSQWISYENDAAFTETLIQAAHVWFEQIHPFEDGNGRTGRMLMNWQRVRNGFEPLCIEAAHRGKYYEWFREE